MSPDNAQDILSPDLYAPPTVLSAFEISMLASDGGLFSSGTICGIVKGEHSGLNEIIRRVQISALEDLYDGKTEPCLAPAELDRCSQITHYAVSAGSQGVYELYWPRARCRTWEELRGTTLYFRRFHGATDAQLHQVALRFEQDITNGVRYDFLALLSFYWRWHLKAARPYRYVELFGTLSGSRDVCSTRVVYNHTKDGLLEDPGTYLWKYYPAQLAHDPLWDDIGHVTIR